MTDDDEDDQDEPVGSRTAETVEQEMREYLARALAAGFDTPPDIAEAALDYFSDESDATITGPLVEKLLPDMLRDHLREQATWPAVTDCDRLDVAFAALTTAGIVARQDFTCCSTCGVAEIGDEIATEVAAGRVVRGYTFFHQQGTESAVEGHGLMLTYGALDETEAAAVKIGEEIVAVLETHGFKCDWDGKIEKCIGVPLVWQRRLEFDRA
jgi:hypothetical protein